MIIISNKDDQIHCARTQKKKEWSCSVSTQKSTAWLAEKSDGLKQIQTNWEEQKPEQPKTKVVDLFIYLDENNNNTSKGQEWHFKWWRRDVMNYLLSSSSIDIWYSKYERALWFFLINKFVDFDNKYFKNYIYCNFN